MEESDILEQQTVSSEQKELEADWAQSEWFENWLRLARREYQGTRVTEQ